jgi:hypothetical protein
MTRARSQNRLRLPQGQRAGDQERFRAIRGVVAQDAVFDEYQRRDRWQQVQRQSNGRDNNFAQRKIQRRQEQIEDSVARYMKQLDPQASWISGDIPVCHCSLPAHGPHAQISTLAELHGFRLGHGL